MLNRRALLALMLAVGVVFLVPACKKPVETTPAPPPAETTPPPAEPEPEQVVEVEEPFKSAEPEVQEVVEPSLEELNRQIQTVYFDFDKYDLSDQTRQTLRVNAEVLKSNAQYNIKIEGHCDERGSIEYNLALGERRANAVRQYLASLGVNESRMRIVSYGEERPADGGHTESAWAKNRRAETVVEP